MGCRIICRGLMGYRMCSRYMWGIINGCRMCRYVRGINEK